MPPPIKPVKNQKEGEYGITFTDSADVDGFFGMLSKYIISQAECPDTKLENKVTGKYVSTRKGGIGVISGIFDARIYKHIMALIDKHEEKKGESMIIIEANVVGEVAADSKSETKSNSSTPDVSFFNLFRETFLIVL